MMRYLSGGEISRYLRPVERNCQHISDRGSRLRPTVVPIHRIKTHHCSAGQIRQTSSSTQPHSHPRPRRRPLEGITVVSLEQAIAAPLCTRHLADQGARVIKIERPDTGDFARHYDDRVDGLCSHFVWVNRSKESLALDLKSSRDRGILEKLLAQTDVLVQNLAPGATRRLGLSYETVRREFPGLIVCDISGYGQDGPYSEKKAYDLLIQSEAGVLSVTGVGDEPVKVGIPISDIAAGMYAYSNILAALIQRGNEKGVGEGGRRGSHIDVSMLESTVEWMGFPMYYAYKNKPGPKPMGASHSAIYPYGPFDTGVDGRTVMLGVQNEREWAKFCEIVMRSSELATDARFMTTTLRSQNRDELRTLIHQVFAELTVTTAIARLDEAGIANAVVNDMHGVWNHPQLQARQRWTEFDSPAGKIPALIPPGMRSGGVEQEKLEVRMNELPTVGQHNTKILAELGIEQ